MGGFGLVSATFRVGSWDLRSARDTLLISNARDLAITTIAITTRRTTSTHTTTRLHVMLMRVPDINNKLCYLPWCLTKLALGSPPTRTYRSTASPEARLRADAPASSSCCGSLRH